MIEKLSYKQKKYVLLALGLLLAWLSWTLAFQKTINTCLQYRELTGQVEAHQGMTFPAAYMGRKQANLVKILGSYHADSAAFRDNLLYQAAFLAGREYVKVIQVPTSEAGNSGTCLQRVTFQGSYFGLVRLLWALKKTKGTGGVRAVRIRQVARSEKLVQPSMDVYFVCLCKKG